MATEPAGVARREQLTRRGSDPGTAPLQGYGFIVICDDFLDDSEDYLRWNAPDRYEVVSSNFQADDLLLQF
jgi:hypothetical protein